MSKLIVNNVEVHLVEKDGVVFANSLEVSEVFGSGNKSDHSDTMGKIRNLIELGVRGFSESSYVDKTNKNRDMYEMNRDAFMMLVNSFSTPRAIEYQMQIIAGINKMEEKLRSLVRKPMTPSEMMLVQAQINVEQESINTKHTEHLTLLDKKIESIASSSVIVFEEQADDIEDLNDRVDSFEAEDEVFPSKNFSSITTLGDEAGLPTKVMKYVLKMNGFEKEECVERTSSGFMRRYIAYRRKDVINACKVVLKKSTGVSKFQYTHPEIAGRWACGLDSLASVCPRQHIKSDRRQQQDDWSSDDTND